MDYSKIHVKCLVNVRHVCRCLVETFEMTGFEGAYLLHNCWEYGGTDGAGKTYIDSGAAKELLSCPTNAGQLCRFDLDLSCRGIDD